VPRSLYDPRKPGYRLRRHRRGRGSPQSSARYTEFFVDTLRIADDLRLAVHLNTRSPRTHCARSLSGVQMHTFCTLSSSEAKRAAEARASSVPARPWPHDHSHRGECISADETARAVPVRCVTRLVAGQSHYGRFDDVIGRHAEMGRALLIICSTVCSTPFTAPQGRSLPLLSGAGRRNGETARRCHQ